MLVLLACSALWLTTAAAEEMSAERFGQRLEQARELNVTAPWEESQALLDELEPHLPHATREQEVDYWLLVARNQALAGQMEAGLATLRELLSGPMQVDQQVRAYSRAANLAMLLRNWEETFEYLIRGLELRDQLDPEDLVHAPFSLAAYLYAKIGETDTAIEYGRQGLSIARTHGTPRDQCVYQGRLAFVYKTADQQDRALRHYRDALAICLTTGDELITGVIESGLGDLLRQAGRHSQAEERLANARKRLAATDYTYGLAEARLYSARLYQELAQFGQARELLELALPQLEQQQAWDYIAEAHEMLAEGAASTGDFRQAFAQMERGLDARQRFLNRDRSRQLAHLQIVFDARSRQQELAVLREQRRAAELEAQSRLTDRRLRWLVSAAVGFLLLVLSLLLVHVVRSRQHFRRLSQLDGLTGLQNHTRFFDTTDLLAEKCARENQPLVLLLADIDHFKRVNDQFGHIAGDRALGDVARVLREHSPEHALVGRIGGEEFAVCLPGATMASAIALVNDLQRRIAAIKYDGADNSALTVSFGVARAKHGESPGSLRVRADQALYRAKHAGRDQVVIADPD